MYKMDLKIIYIILGVIFVISFGLWLKLKKGAKFITGMIACICIILGCVFSFSPLLDNINYGLDLQGGFEVLYEISPLDDKSKLDSDMLYNTYQCQDEKN